MSQPTKHRIAAALAAALLGATVGTAAAGTGYKTDAVDARGTQISGCVIRFSNADGTPSIHANAAHRCAGVKSVDINEYGELRLWQTVTGAPENPILWAFCQTDETLGGMRGITCGASGGTGNTRFRLYDSKLGRSLDLNKQADRDRVQGKNANLWVGWVHTTWGAS